MLQPDITCALEELRQGLGQSLRISDEGTAPWTREATLRPVKKPEAVSCVRRGCNETGFVGISPSHWGSVGGFTEGSTPRGHGGLRLGYVHWEF